MSGCEACDLELTSGSHRLYETTTAGSGLEAAIPCGICTPEGFQSPGEALLPQEQILHVSAGGTPLADLACSPSDLGELALGHVLSEGVAASAADILSVSLDAATGSVQVSLRTPPALPRPRWAAEAASGAPELAALEPVVPIPWEASWVFTAARELDRDTPAHRATYGTHSCFLLLEGTILYCCEDIGRRNAFDKAIGCALRDGVDLSRCMVFASGRIPSDMVAKAVRARVPILASKAVPTSRTVQLAKEHQLTLICSARLDSMRVFNDPQTA